ncbi:MAG: putative metal-dependent hydrolase YcfH [Chlamydiia bacterium]|nr:putative metal-dependent hydrolase YcfH [Chlamydiia bacterium]MCH9616299.1 putative metal-dependent hydrolase YcfH [Chlamydiia bacterium]MCH9629715.1 putative metal-dependent hydrolase YcfH [Chlamydiia bacterium]
MFFDSHAHLTSSDVLPELPAILERAKAANVTRMANICTDIPTLEAGLKLDHPGIVNIGATTPHDVGKEGALNFPTFEKAAREGKLKAIGETGLDYFYEHSDKKTQKTYLIKYLELATELNLPVVIHCREAFDDLFDFTKDFKGTLILHCFTGTMDEAKEVLKRGWYLSLSGIVTFKKSLELQEVAKIVPLKQMLIETDTPYLAPRSKRGKQNEPAYVVETAGFIADLKEITVDELAKATFDNASDVFFPS